MRKFSLLCVATVTCIQPSAQEDWQKFVGSDPFLYIRLSRSETSHLRLGAAEFAQDGFGIEDEPALPNVGSPFHTRREGWRLETDFVRYQKNGLMAWEIEYGDAGSKTHGNAAVVSILLAPVGISVWALGENAFTPSHLSLGDTVWHPGNAGYLRIWAGSRNALERMRSQLRGNSDSSPPFEWHLESHDLVLNLLDDADLSIRQWFFDGRGAMPVFFGSLPSGRQRFDLRGFQERDSKTILRVQYRGKSRSGNFSIRLPRPVP